MPASRSGSTPGSAGEPPGSPPGASTRGSSRRSAAGGRTACAERGLPRGTPCASADGGPDEREHLRLEALLLAFRQRLQRSAEQDGESMDAGPDRELDARATIGGEDSGVDEVVEGGLQMVERRALVGLLTGGMVGGRERRVEKARFRPRGR